MATPPKGAKVPTDRQPKADEQKSRKVTVRGVEFEVADDALNDFELLDDLSALEDESLEEGERVTRLPSILRRIAGKNSRKLIATARDEETGKVTIEAGAELVGEVLGALDPNS